MKKQFQVGDWAIKKTGFSNDDFEEAGGTPGPLRVVGVSLKKGLPKFAGIKNRESTFGWYGFRHALKEEIDALPIKQGDWAWSRLSGQTIQCLNDHPADNDNATSPAGANNYRHVTPAEYRSTVPAQTSKDIFWQKKIPEIGDQVYLHNYRMHDGLQGFPTSSRANVWHWDCAGKTGNIIRVDFKSGCRTDQSVSDDINYVAICLDDGRQLAWTGHSHWHSADVNLKTFRENLSTFWHQVSPVLDMKKATKKLVTCKTVNGLTALEWKKANDKAEEDVRRLLIRAEDAEMSLACRDKRVESLQSQLQLAKPMHCGRWVAGWAPCMASTGICGKSTFGWGDLDSNGYWEYPCTFCKNQDEEFTMTPIDPKTDLDQWLADAAEENRLNEKHSSNPDVKVVAKKAIKKKDPQLHNSHDNLPTIKKLDKNTMKRVCSVCSKLLANEKGVRNHQQATRCGVAILKNIEAMNQSGVTNLNSIPSKNEKVELAQIAYKRHVMTASCVNDVFQTAIKYTVPFGTILAIALKYLGG